MESCIIWILFILSLLKSLVSWYLESIETGWTESSKEVSMELHFVKNNLRFSYGKIFLKPEFMRDTSEFDWSKNGNVFDWHRKHMYGMFCFKFSWLYCLYWCRAYEILLGKSCKKLGLVLFLLFYCSHCRRLLLQSMQSSSNCRLYID